MAAAQDTSFLVLYRGPDVERARVVAISAAPDLVRRFARELLERQRQSDDPATGAVDRGRREALKLILAEKEEEEL